MELDHISRGCKGHLRHTTTPTKSLSYLLGALLLILPGPSLLFGPIHLCIMPNQLLIHFNPMLNHNLSGMQLIRSRPQYNSPLALFPPPLAQPQPLPPAPPRKPQMIAQPNLNSNKRQAQQVYSGEPSCPTYAVEIQEINLRFGKVLPDSQPPPKEVEEDKEESEPKAIPPFPERLSGTTQSTP